jgi:uncharacterized protein YndB with AHSA1/START domain
MKTDTKPFTIEKSFDVPVSKVWKAITNSELMKQWYFDIDEFKPEIGFEFRFYGGSEYKKYLHQCKITEVVTGKKISYSWCYDGYPGKSIVSCELFEEDDKKTKLKLTHEGLETFPANNPDFAEKSFAEGWTYIIGTSLKEFLENTPD